jgi:hypothetical protein
MALILTGASGSTTLDSSAGLTFSDTSNQSAAASPYVLKNRIINGDMRIDQRNAGASKSYSASAITYSVDRFFLFPTGAAVTGQQVAGTNTGTGYAFRITGATGNTACNFSQRIENLNTLDLNSATVTISFKAYASTSISNIQIAAFCGTSANSGYGGGNNAFSSIFSLASGLNTISQTITLPSTASNGFELAIGFGSGIGNGVTVDLSNVQLEIGSTATPFERRLYNQELANCQRYYQRISVNGTTNGAAPLTTGFGTGSSTTTAQFIICPIVTMRTNSSLGVSSQTTMRVWDGVNAASVTTAIGAFAGSLVDSSGAIQMVATVSSGLTTYRPYVIIAPVSGTAFLELNGEL